MTRDRITEQDETLIGRNLPDQVKWPDAWRELVDTVRQLPTKAFWEIFSGSVRATKGFKRVGWAVAPPIDVADEPWFNLLLQGFIAIIIGPIWKGRIAILWLGPPCSSFSMAVNRFVQYAMRSQENPDGLPNLIPHRKEKSKNW